VGGLKSSFISLHASGGPSTKISPVPRQALGEGPHHAEGSWFADRVAWQEPGRIRARRDVGCAGGCRDAQSSRTGVMQA